MSKAKKPGAEKTAKPDGQTGPDSLPGRKPSEAFLAALAAVAAMGKKGE